MFCYYMAAILLGFLLYPFSFQLNYLIRINSKKEAEKQFVLAWLPLSFITYRLRIGLPLPKAKKEKKAKKKKNSALALSPRDIFQLIGYGLKSLRLPLFRLEMELGIGKPLLTTQVIGLIWIALGSFYGILSQKLKRIDQHPYMDIKANWQETSFFCQGKCILSFSCGNIIINAIRWLLVRQKQKGRKLWRESMKSKV